MKLGFLGAFTLLLIAAKLWGVISWSWWAVLFPMYGPLLFVLTFIGAAALGIVVMKKKWGKSDGCSD